ncbi:MAG: hypothetical protein AAF383_25710, partial [Cyanobacteria bacterium P01_A01_bin.83]
MNKNSRLYNALNQWIGQPVDWSHRCHLKTCIWLIVALIHTGSVNLTKWSIYIPCRGKFAQSRQRRIQRWLNNPRINVHRLYKPIMQPAVAGKRRSLDATWAHTPCAALSNWQEETMFLALDTSLFWDEYCLVRLCVIHRRRALPHEHSSKTRLASLACFAGCVWRVMKHNSASVSFQDYQQIIQHSIGRLPKGVKVVLLADRGFVHTELMAMLTHQLGWHYRIRLKSNTWIWRGNKGWIQLHNFHLNRGQAICLHNLRLHKGAYYG